MVPVVFFRFDDLDGLVGFFRLSALFGLDRLDSSLSFWGKLLSPLLQCFVW
jgi:hypothetical protein